MCQPEVPLPYGVLTALLSVAALFMLVRRAWGQKGSDDIPINETGVFLLLAGAWIVAVNLEFGPQIMSHITGRAPTNESGLLESEHGTGPNRQQLNKICVSGNCYSAPTIGSLIVEEGADGIMYDVYLLFRQPAYGKLILWPDTGLGGVRVKSLQICDPDWVARARVK